jgi:hypothetical protein
MVVHGGDGDRGGVNLEIGSQQLSHSCEDGDVVFGGMIGGTRGVGLNSSDQGNALASLFQFAIDAEVIAAERSSSGNGNFQNGLAHYADAPLPSTALRQRL